jgi:NADPH-dependent 2,4-dienoyl-CoA reductase/sulfur reductase-like enzyme
VVWRARTIAITDGSEREPARGSDASYRPFRQWPERARRLSQSREGRSAAIGCWGATFTESHDRHGYIGAVATDSSTTPGEVDVLVIGAGQAGLAMGCHLAERGLSFVVADANPEVGHVWRSRWESLRLFTAGQFNNLPGMSFPAARDSYPGKDEVAEFLRSYVRSSISQSG